MSNLSVYSYNEKSGALSHVANVATWREADQPCRNIMKNGLKPLVYDQVGTLRRIGFSGGKASKKRGKGSENSVTRVRLSPLTEITRSLEAKWKAGAARRR